MIQPPNKATRTPYQINSHRQLPSLSNVIIFYDYFTPAYKAGGPTQSLHNLMTLLGEEEIKLVATNKDFDNIPLPVKPDKWLPFNNTTGKVWYASESSQAMIGEMIKSDSILYINSIYSHNFDYQVLIKSKAKGKLYPREACWMQDH